MADDPIGDCQRRSMSTRARSNRSNVVRAGHPAAAHASTDDVVLTLGLTGDGRVDFRVETDAVRCLGVIAVCVHKPMLN